MYTVISTVRGKTRDRVRIEIKATDGDTEFQGIYLSRASKASKALGVFGYILTINSYIIPLSD